MNDITVSVDGRSSELPNIAVSVLKTPKLKVEQKGLSLSVE